MNTKIYVGNIAFQTTESDLKTLFSQAGDVVSVKILKDQQTGQSRGFGFVTMPTEAEGKAAVAQMNGSDLKGYNVNVEEARSKPTVPSFGGASRRGGPRGRGRPGGDRRGGGGGGGGFRGRGERGGDRGERGGGRPRY